MLVRLFFLLVALPLTAFPEEKAVTVGLVSVLSGDMAVLGRNIVDTAETYRRHYLRHNLRFVQEDAKLSSADGLHAYQKLISMDAVDMIVGACSSNCTMAAKGLINSSNTPVITVVTGGSNIDNAGPYVFRIGNSDTLNGYQEAEAFLKAGQKRVALLAEETEYTQDIANAFKTKFSELGGDLVAEDNFSPGTTDFRTNIALIKRARPDGIFLPTQTGTPLGLFLKQWHEQGGERSIPIHTTFVAAPNPDAHRIAGELIEGVYYMNPEYDRENPRFREFLDYYKQDHNKSPEISFHTAGTVDTLDLLQLYLDSTPVYSREGFQKFLLANVKNYKGLMGTYSFDSEGNADIGFRLAVISKTDREDLR